MGTNELVFPGLNKVTDEAIETISISWDPILVQKNNQPKLIVLDFRTFDALQACIKDMINLTQSEEIQKPHSEKLINQIQLAKDALSHIKEFQEAYIKLLLCISAMMDAHEDYLGEHSQRLALLACDTARKLGCTQNEVDDIKNAALLHDIGEAMIPHFVLDKPGKLSSEDWQIVKEHPRVGAEFVAVVKSLENVAKIVYTHHEKFDGTGYPNSISGESIPLGARILQVVDAYDAMTNPRSHREVINHQEAEVELRKFSGSAFDPKVVDAFLNLF